MGGGPHPQTWESCSGTAPLLWAGDYRGSLSLHGGSLLLPYSLFLGQGSRGSWKLCLGTPLLVCRVYGRGSRGIETLFGHSSVSTQGIIGDPYPYMSVYVSLDLAGLRKLTFHGVIGLS
jgi:hypothetical protein